MFDKEAIIELTKAEATAQARETVEQALTGDCAAALPNDFKIHDLEKFMPTRRRARGTMETYSVNSFARYVEDHRQDGATVFIDQDSMAAVAILNLGTPTDPGHADQCAKITAKRTAAYKALQAIVNAPRSQQSIAEFFEDWSCNFEFFRDDLKMTAPKAIAAVRKLTIEALRKLETEENQLSASRSTFESVKATSGEDPIPSKIYFTCQPFSGLESRMFVLRLSIQTTGDKPAIVLRVVNQEQHDEEMADELAELVKEAISNATVLVGKYSPSN